MPIAENKTLDLETLLGYGPGFDIALTMLRARYGGEVIVFVTFREEDPRVEGLKDAFTIDEDDWYRCWGYMQLGNFPLPMVRAKTYLEALALLEARLATVPVAAIDAWRDWADEVYDLILNGVVVHWPEAQALVARPLPWLI